MPKGSRRTLDCYSSRYCRTPPRSKAQFQYILVIQDLFTKWIECAPLRSANGKKIRDLFKELIINRWGTPRVILTDNGTEFINSTIRHLAEEYNIVHSTTPPYHPQANPVERVNRVLKTMIISYIGKDHRSWDENLAEFRFAYNTAYHSSIKATRAFLNLGREPKPTNFLRGRLENAIEVERQPHENWNERMKRLKVIKDWVVQYLDVAFNNQSRRYNLRRREVRYRKGDLVLARNRQLSSKEKNVAAKLCPKFNGSFKITDGSSPVVYEISSLDGSKKSKIHMGHFI